MLLAYVIIQECLLLFEGDFSKGFLKIDKFRYEFKGIDKPNTVTFLSNQLFGICTLITQKSLTSETKDIFILLLSDLLEQQPMTDKQLKKQDDSFTIEKKLVGISPRMSYSEAKSPFKRTIHTPRKYLNLLKRKRLISMKSIIKLVKIMDVDLSNRVDLGELKAFIRKQDLHHNIPDHLAEAMFWDAACCRKIYVEKNLGEPLTDTEIYSATRVKYMIDPRTKEQIAVPRRFRE
jgi:hypothetical protein